ncbi:MAG: 50S ribosomal protein L24 [Candidatus Moranbacteria bacterium RIFOXYA12_FULL_44_15]|nr:MAG: 50S ribosomal protein L24 [Candidatus Moranbacteria bacterium RIFOXYA12_FULL_44_15]OGI34236.1 MAG: 50S ribosomal protein L24 [Candidatus Moranbacteria bacterium RIFOXYA2_FULL_43_15]
MRIKKNDIVKMIAGKDRGKTGKVLRVLPKDRKAVVEGLNVVKKHTRPKREGEKGQRVEIPRGVTVSNMALVCPKCGKTSRIGYKTTGKIKVRICKKCGSEI